MPKNTKPKKPELEEEVEETESAADTEEETEVEGEEIEGEDFEDDDHEEEPAQTAKAKAPAKRRIAVEDAEEGSYEPSFCAQCKREHNGTFDGPFVNHDRFPIGGKEEAMFDNLVKQPDVQLIVPLGQGEAAGSTCSPQLNGLRINIVKGKFVKLPQQVAETILESMALTAAIPAELETVNPTTGKRKKANLELRGQEERDLLS